jgi:SpoVK/Ycf46/Vps4 family AAA+-type ATPase
MYVELIRIHNVQDANSVNKRVTGLWTIPSRNNESRTATLLSDQTTYTESNEHDVSTQDLKQSTQAAPSTSAKTNKRIRSSGKDTVAKRQKIDRSPPTGVSLSDIGGIDNILDDIRDLIDMPLNCAFCYEHLGIQIPRYAELHCLYSYLLLIDKRHSASWTSRMWQNHVGQCHRCGQLRCGYFRLTSSDLIVLMM